MVAVRGALDISPCDISPRRKLDEDENEHQLQPICRSRSGGGVGVNTIGPDASRCRVTGFSAVELFVV